jgi:hypothetical protein
VDRPLFAEEMTLSAIKRSGAYARMAFFALVVNGFAAVHHFSIFEIFFVMAFVAHFRITGLAGFLGMAGTAGELLLVFAVLGVVVMTFEASDTIAFIMLEMLEKRMTGGTAILNAIGYLGGLDGKGGET